MTEPESLESSRSLSEWERREDRLHNERMLVVMPQIDEFYEQELQDEYDLIHHDEEPPYAWRTSY